MPVTPVPTITPLPQPPDPNDRSTFNVRAYPWSAAQQTLATEIEAVADNVYDNAQAAADAAALAVPAAAAAEAASNATLWVSGTTYAAGDVVWSPINALSYRRKSAGSGTTDPSVDSANWASLASGTLSLMREARTSNTILGPADKGKLIDITSGTFSQTFDAVATLGDGWWCYLRNSGTGDITLDPNSTELIDGLSNYVMYPGETRLVQCDSAALRSIVITSYSKVFSASGAFIEPPGYSARYVKWWAAGGSGRKDSDATLKTGGGGGGAWECTMKPSAPGTSASIVIGAGGASVTASATDGAGGGDTTAFGVTVYGGKGGSNSPAAGGGSIYSANSLQVTSSASGGSAIAAYYGGAASAVISGRTPTVHGGGAGGAIDASNVLWYEGLTVTGGAGGAAVLAADGVDGTAPGGGGGATATGSKSGAGARGEVRIWGVV